MNAQLKVDTSGNTEVIGKLSITGNISGTGNDNYVVDIQREGNSTSTSYSGMHINVSTVGNSTFKSIGLLAEAGKWVGNTPTASGIGVKGVSNMAGYGVVGLINGTVPVGVGVYGGTGSIEMPLDGGLYAGYFAGSVKITNQLIVNSTTYNSDLRLKQNIVDLGDFSTMQNTNGVGSSQNNGGILSTVLSMNPIQYNIRQMYFASVGDTASVGTAMFDENSQLFQKKHYGLIAQELQTLYPDLVYVGQDGYLSVDYIGIIPLLIQSIKELKAQIDNKGGLIVIDDPVIYKTPSISKSVGNNPASVPSLSQNMPNPFSQATEINYFLPSTINNALLCIYDLNGRQLKQILLTQRGEGSQIISGSEFAAGIYLYALIADSKEIDVKRMILTE